MDTQYINNGEYVIQKYVDSNGREHQRRFVSNMKYNSTKVERSAYLAWQRMRNRCHASNAPYSRYYYDKNIKICDEWDNLDNGFENFYRWAMTHGYEIGLSLDRIDSSQGYSPENCRWITVNENRRLGVSQPHKPKWRYIAYNLSKKIALIFEKTIEFRNYTGLDERRISDGCKNPNYEYKGWKFKRRAINLDYYEGLETISEESTLENELPSEVQVIYLPTKIDEDIVHTA